MAKDDLDKLRELLAKATPGPWRLYVAAADEGIPTVWGISDGIAPVTHVEKRQSRSSVATEANAALIVAAVNALPSLIGRIDMLEDTIVELWHESEAAREPLHHYFGMTEEEYARWANPSALVRSE